MRLALPASGFRRQVAQLASGTLFAQVFLVALTPVIFRLYSKPELDALSGFSGIFLSLAYVMALRFEQGIPLAEDRTKAIHLVRLCFVVSVGLSGLLWLCLVFFGGPIAKWLSLPLLAEYPWVLPVALLGGSLYITGSSWFTREQDFGVVARTILVQALAMGVFQVLGSFVFVGRGALALSLGLAVGRSAGVLTYLKRISSVDEWKEPIRPDAMAELAKRYGQFAWLNAPGTLANNLGLQIPALMLLSLFPVGSATAFFAASRVVGSPMTMLGAAVAQAYQGEASRLVREAPQELLGFYDKTILRLAKASLIVLFVGCSAPFWLHFFVGANASRAGLWAAILSPSFCLTFICSPISMTASVVEKLGGQFVLDIVRIAVTAGSFAVPHIFHWNADLAIATYSATSTVMYIFYVAYYRKCAASVGERST